MREYMRETGQPCWITGARQCDPSHLFKTVGAGADWTYILPMNRFTHRYYEERMKNEVLWLRRYPGWSFSSLERARQKFQSGYLEWLERRYPEEAMALASAGIDPTRPKSWPGGE